MSTWGDKVGTQSRSDAGVGVSAPPLPAQDPQDVIYSSWQRGLYTADSPEDIPRESVQDSSDVRVTRDDGLRRLEGVTQDQNVAPREVAYLFEHAGVDFSTELIVIDPPYLGYKSAGAFTFVNLGIVATGDRGWNVVNIAGTLLFSNGSSGTYTREPGSAIVTDISADVIADTFATQFGRVFAGSYTDPVSGLQGLAIRWNGTGATPASDWGSINAGAELLLSNTPEADRIVALRPVGFDILAILTRKAVWVGNRTNVANRPADFKQRFNGFGCVSEATAVVSPHGIIYVGDEGVTLFDINSVKIISPEINNILLPLDYLQIGSYRGVYQPYRDRYVLKTPTGVWYYEFGNDQRPPRWYFSSYVPESLVIFTDQSGNVYWDTVQGTWDDQDLTWDEMIQGELNAPAVLYFGNSHKIGFEDSVALDYMGVAQNPYATTTQNLKNPSDLVSTIWFEIEYATDDATTLTLKTPDEDGTFVFTKTVNLPDTNGAKLLGVFGFTGTGQGSTIQVVFPGKTATIYRIRQVFLPAGPVQSVLS